MFPFTRVPSQLHNHYLHFLVYSPASSSLLSTLFFGINFIFKLCLSSTFLQKRSHFILLSSAKRFPYFYIHSYFLSYHSQTVKETFRLIVWVCCYFSRIYFPHQAHSIFWKGKENDWRFVHLLLCSRAFVPKTSQVRYDNLKCSLCR